MDVSLNNEVSITFWKLAGPRLHIQTQQLVQSPDMESGYGPDVHSSSALVLL